MALSSLKSKKTGELFFEIGTVLVNGFYRKHLAHIRTAEDPPTIPVPPPNKAMGRCPSFTMHHDHNLNEREMADMEAVCCGGPNPI